MQVQTPWSPTSWRQFPAKQQPVYPDAKRVGEVTEKISSMPPLVAAGEINSLRRQLADAETGRRFLLQGGDCAEAFKDCRADLITNKLKIILQMSLVLCYGARCPVIRVGRIAGQYAKPRSQDFEIIDGQKIPCYRGDIINELDPTLQGRTPAPERMLESYHNASVTLNFLRSLIVGGFADLHHPEHWDLTFLQNSKQRQRYELVVDSIRDAVSFVSSLGGIRTEKLDSVDFYTSHEGLLLPYEEALTRESEQGYYNLSAHMLWIGDRTRQLDGAHIEYFRGIRNPIGVKVGPSATPQDIVEILLRLNPAREHGKLVMITRFGAERVTKDLPAFIDAVKEAAMPVVWSCDPMHGNTIKAEGGRKTRDFAAILKELTETFSVHAKRASCLGGVHFELTGEDVTECIGGAQGLTGEDLGRNYNTYCDPRLNYTQSLEMAFQISALLRETSQATASLRS